MKAGKIIIFSLIILAFGLGIYFRDNVFKFYINLGKQVQNFKKSDIGQIISEVQKKVSEPGPLNIGGTEKNVVLLKSKIIEETNLQRFQNANMASLKENVKLDEAAAAKANDMFLNQYFEHISPTGIEPGELVQGYGYEYIVAGENLILGNFASEKEVVQKWMDSPGHRANIINSRYTEIGVAIIKGVYNGETVWIGVQEFGLPLATCNQPDENLRNQIDAEKSQLDIWALEIAEKKKQLDTASKDAHVYNQMVDDYNQLIAQYDSLAEQIKSAIAIFNNQVNIFNNCVAGK
jgi:uncharacterized protein YkwD